MRRSAFLLLTFCAAFAFPRHVLFRDNFSRAQCCSKCVGVRKTLAGRGRVGHNQYLAGLCVRRRERAVLSAAAAAAHCCQSVAIIFSVIVCSSRPPG